MKRKISSSNDNDDSSSASPNHDQKMIDTTISDRDSDQQLMLYLEVFIPKCLLPNQANDSIFHIKSFSNEIFQNVLNVITYTVSLSLNEISPKIFLNKLKGDSTVCIEIDPYKAFAEYNIEPGDFLELRENSTQNSKSVTRAYKNNNSLAQLNDVIEIICKTYMSDYNGNPLKKIYVKAYKNDKLEILMHDISKIWGKSSSLKFKFGHNILASSKTFDDYNIMNGSEIIVSGGR